MDTGDGGSCQVERGGLLSTVQGCPDSAEKYRRAKKDTAKAVVEAMKAWAWEEFGQAMAGENL